MRSSHPASPRAAGLIVLACLAVLACAYAAAAGASPAAFSAQPASANPAAAGAKPTGAGRAEAEAEAAQVTRYWTPARMRAAVPLDLELRDGRLSRVESAPANPLASASFKPVATPTTAPYSVNGRIFVRQGNLKGYCSGTAINSPTRQLVLTAAHCVNSGPRPGGRAAVWSQYLEFVPAYTGGATPFGTFVARRNYVRAPQPWIKGGNPDFDLGAFRVFPNEEGVNVADAVGGGATIVIDQDRNQKFQTFGYPGESTRMQSCQSPYVGDDLLTNRFAGPPTMGIRCHWAPGASGGGWLIAEGSEINGVNTYLHTDDASKTYGPYFNFETVGKLTAGL